MEGPAVTAPCEMRPVRWALHIRARRCALARSPETPPESSLGGTAQPVASGGACGGGEWRLAWTGGDGEWGRRRGGRTGQALPEGAVDVVHEGPSRGGPRYLGSFTGGIRETLYVN